MDPSYYEFLKQNNAIFLKQIKARHVTLSVTLPVFDRHPVISDPLSTSWTSVLSACKKRNCQEKRWDKTFIWNIFSLDHDW